MDIWIIYLVLAIEAVAMGSVILWALMIVCNALFGDLIEKGKQVREYQKRLKENP